MIYWQGINIGDRQFFRKFANIKIANIKNYVDMPMKLEKKNAVARNINIKSINCFSQTKSLNITLANKLSCTRRIKSTSPRTETVLRHLYK